MIEKIRIENYKNFKSFEFDGFKRVNLIAGKNNTGKTNLLEAIHFHIHKFVPEVIVGSIIFRLDNVSSSLFLKRDVSYLSALLDKGLARLFRKGSTEMVVELDGRRSGIKLRNYNTVWIKMGEKVHAQRAPLESSDDPNFPKMFQVINPDWTYEKLINLESEDLAARSVENKIRFGFVLPTVPRSLTEGNLSNLRKNNLFEQFLGALNLVSIPIADLFFIEDETFGTKDLMFKDSISKTSNPISELGFGTNRILEIFSELFLASGNKEGVLLIDEVDLGLHFSIQEKFWTIVFELSQKLNVQIFATTHSRDCFNAFAWVANQEENLNEGRFIRLQQDGDSTKVIDYDDNLMLGAARFGDEVR
jgi:AAA15 family ATPase/GTPase